MSIVCDIITRAIYIVVYPPEIATTESYIIIFYYIIIIIVIAMCICTVYIYIYMIISKWHEFGVNDEMKMMHTRQFTCRFLGAMKKHLASRIRIKFEMWLKMDLVWDCALSHFVTNAWIYMFWSPLLLLLHVSTRIGTFII